MLCSAQSEMKFFSFITGKYSLVFGLCVMARRICIGLCAVAEMNIIVQGEEATSMIFRNKYCCMNRRCQSLSVFWFYIIDKQSFSHSHVLIKHHRRAHKVHDGNWQQGTRSFVVANYISPLLDFLNKRWTLCWVRSFILYLF